MQRAAAALRTMAKAVKIGTHNGQFHCDEVLACCLLRSLPEYKDAQIVRTRDAAVLNGCDVVVDVGGVFDAASKRFDHHQKSFSETMRSLGCGAFDTRLSSAGLVYAHYGRSVLKLAALRDGQVTVNEADLTRLYGKVYEHFVEAIDAIDNGVTQFDGEPRYSMTTSLSSRVGYLNPRWNTPSTEIDQDAAFEKAMVMVEAEFNDRFLYYLDAWLPARQLVVQAVEKRFQVDASGRILSFEGGGLPWKEHFFDIETEQNLGDLKIAYVIFPDDSGDWRVMAIPKNAKEAFVSRVALPEKWRGVRDEQLSEIADVEGCVFCHATGFIGGNRSRDGALKMARIALNLPH